MVRPPRFDSNGVKSGVWSKEEDDTLRAFVEKNGHHNWQKLPFLAGLARSGKSCRLRWMNYLQPGLKKGNFSKEEVDLIIRLHNQIGNRWSVIAENLGGRTDNDIKNHWHAHIKKRGAVAKAEMGHQEQTPGGILNNQENNTNRFMSTPLIPEEEFSDFGLRHMNDHTCFTQFNIDDPFPEQKDFSDFGSCHNYDSSDQLNIDLPPLIPEEEFSTFLDSSNGDYTYSFTQQINVHLSPLIPEDLFSTCRNDTPTFSDSSDTCFTQLSIDPPQFREEHFSAFGVYKNDTPSFSDSSDGADSILRDVFYLNHLERTWYFGDDV